jgi:hypothetical protein
MKCVSPAFCVVRSQPFTLEKLDNCEVLLLDHSETVQADNITNCKIFIGVKLGFFVHFD